MRTTRRAILGTAAATLSLAGCLGGDGDPPTADSPTESEPTDTEVTETPTEEPTEDGSHAVRVRSHPEFGDVLVGSAGMTLYMFDQDERGLGESSCTDGCLDNWPPLTVDDGPGAGDDVTAEVTSFARPDGSMQVSANGWPLYYYAPDEEPGDASGQGVGDIWWVLDPADEPIRSDEGGGGDTY